ncbi:hypothetical protein QJQ45_024302, partial [Haematococcus lacustris]
MLFTGIFCLLAGLAAASTAAVTTIVAAPTEAEQADAAPASGASTGVKKGCDDLTASGLNLSQILTDVELLYPFLYKLISMLADTDAAMR